MYHSIGMVGGKSSLKSTWTKYHFSSANKIENELQKNCTSRIEKVFSVYVYCDDDDDNKSQNEYMSKKINRDWLKKTQ